MWSLVVVVTDHIVKGDFLFVKADLRKHKADD